ncbi:hypothetical protein DL767_010766 [Monosporascus sp. MG133]|nr:hypothetical protein DL767_010766 [Monosporascus sp. MG133]
MDSQESLIRHVYGKANLDYEVTRYVEAHGTGTILGDPVEMGALGRVFKESRSAKEPLYVGSIKANIGHLEAASGLAGVLKSVLILEKGVIPANALFEKLNPRIDSDSLRVTVPSTNVAWPSSGLRRVSVNSFGFGGTNSHVVLDSAHHYLQDHGLVGNHNCTNLSPNPDGDSDSSMEHHSGQQLNGSSQPVAPKLLVWTAASEKAASRLTQDYLAYYQTHLRPDAAQLDRLAYTLATRRSRLKWRSFAVIDAVSDARRNTGFSTMKPIPEAGNAPSIAFIFTGQGAQYSGMGLELIQYEAFKQSLHRTERIYRDLGCKWSFFDELHNEHNIHRPEYSQPLCTGLQIALVDLMSSFGVTPVFVVGHSSGEIAASYSVGALSHESACKVAYYRGQMASRTRMTGLPSAMMAVNLSKMDVLSYLKSLKSETLRDAVHVACVNSPFNCTLAGPEKAIDRLKGLLDREKIFTQKLNTGVAYHTPAMKEVAAQYLELMGVLDRGSGNANGTLISSVTGHTVSSEVLTAPQYWVDNLISPVEFSLAVSHLMQRITKANTSTKSSVDLVEIGPHSALRRPLKDIIDHASPGQGTFRYNSVLTRSKPSYSTTLELLGQLFCQGHPVLITEANQQSARPQQGAIPPLVDGPKYPFDHSHKYWHESRLSRDYRLRGSSSGLVLGRRSHDWNPLEPTWRNFLSLESMPWLGDHVVTGRTIYPGAGMLVMAIEAVREVMSRNRRIHGYYVKEAHFLKALTVAETDELATETVLRLRRLKQTYEKESTWSEVAIFAYYDDRWDECFQGKIQVQYEEAPTQVDGGQEERLESQAILRNFACITESCTAAVDSHSFYNFCKTLGIDYGKSFQLLEGIRCKPDKSAIAHINVTEASYQTLGLVHPAVLDAANQLVMAQMCKRPVSSVPTLVPRQLKSAWIAASGWGRAQTTSIRLLSISKGGPSGALMESSLYGIADDSSILCAMEHLSMAPVSRNEATVDRPTNIMHGIEWKPQLSLLSPQQLQALCSLATAVPEEEQRAIQDRFRRLDSAMVAVIHRALKNVPETELRNAPAYLRQYATTMKYHLSHSFSPYINNVSSEDLHDCLRQVMDELPEMEMVSLVGLNIKSILRGEIDPLELIFSTDCAERLYAKMFSLPCDGRFRMLLDLMSHENPSLRILEVGAGTGGVTQHVLSAIDNLEQQTGASLFTEYTYTDISASFFSKAKAKFQKFEERMTFKTFDLQRKASDQNFELADYDVIIAGSVFHATADLHATLRNVRQLLKPGGRLVMLEMVMPNTPFLNITFGVLPGWWLSKEEWRAHSPLVTEEQWDKIYKNTGFSGNDLIIRDFDTDVWHAASIIATTAVQQSQPEGQRSRCVLVVDPLCEDQIAIAEKLRGDQATKILHLNELNGISDNLLVGGDTVISLLEVRKPFLVALSERDFHGLQTLVRHSKNLLWVTTSSAKDIDHSHYGLMVGLFRSIRSEAEEKHIVTLSIEASPLETVDDWAGYIKKVLEVSFTSAPYEIEFSVRDGLILTGRLVEEVAMNETIQSLLSTKWETQPWLPGPAVRLEVGTPGVLDTLQFVEDEAFRDQIAVDPGELHPDEVEMEAKTWAVSFRDIFIALGRLPGHTLGFECAGIVKRVGTNCLQTFRPGQKVCMTTPGCMRSYPRSHVQNVFRIPNDVSFQLAVSAINPGATAYHALVDLAQLQKGERILVHSASGGTGQMALWIAKMIGAEIFVTVGLDEKKQLLIDEFGIPEERIFYSRNASFARGIMRVTGGQGVDVVLNSLSGDGLRASWECIAPYGRFVEIGKTDIMSDASLPMSGFDKNVSFFALDLHHLALSRPSLLRHIVKSLMDLLDQKKIHYPRPIHSYPVSDVEGAFRYIQSGKNTGRVVISIDPSVAVPKLIGNQNRWAFPMGATYLVAGGLGGVGRAIIKWMARKGAKNLILPSRTGPTSGAARETILELQKLGVNVVTPICDVSVARSLEELLRDCGKRMPPIKGCINAAMVLQDAAFYNMNHTQWELAVRSKVDVSWNLHQHLPGLDFFVLLSSLSGIYGSVAQANYAAGCTFQDSLARYRTSNGEKAVSLDLGWMRTIGIIAETEKYQRYRENARDMIPLEEAELMAVLDIYCRPSRQALHPEKSQLLMGSATPAYWSARGQSPIPSMLRPLFSTFRRVAGRQSAQDVKSMETDSPATRFRQSTDMQERVHIVASALAAKLARSLSISPEDVQSSKHLSDYGVDSLMAIELRNWIEKEFQAHVAVFDIMDGSTTIAAISDLVAQRGQYRS